MFYCFNGPGRGDDRKKAWEPDKVLWPRTVGSTRDSDINTVPPTEKQAGKNYMHIYAYMFDIVHFRKKQQHLFVIAFKHNRILLCQYKKDSKLSQDATKNSFKLCVHSTLYYKTFIIQKRNTPYEGEQA